MREQFVEKTFSAKTQAMIGVINSILAGYEAQGYRLSLRQLYYQLVARAIIENSLQSYKRIGDIVSNARLAGLIDWAMIEVRNGNRQRTLLRPLIAGMALTSLSLENRRGSWTLLTQRRLEIWSLLPSHRCATMNCMKRR